jgi:hypothetical protein
MEARAGRHKPARLFICKTPGLSGTHTTVSINAYPGGTAGYLTTAGNRVNE